MYNENSQIIVLSKIRYVINYIERLESIVYRNSTRAFDTLDKVPTHKKEFLQKCDYFFNVSHF